MSGSGRETPADVREWSGGYPDVQEWSEGPPECPGVVGMSSQVVGSPSRVVRSPSQMSGSGQEALPDVWKWS